MMGKVDVDEDKLILYRIIAYSIITCQREQKSVTLILIFMLTLFLFLGSALAATPNRINHKGNDIFLNGINVAWGISGFCNDVDMLDPSCIDSPCAQDREFFENMVSELSFNGGNSIRLWLHGDGGYVPVIDNNYSDRMVANITETQLASIQWLLDLGKKYNILFNLCLWSFDMVNDNGYGEAHGLWNKIITDDAHTQAYIDNWLVPMITAFKDHDNLLSVEVFNEPEGMIQEYGGWTNCTSGSPDCAMISIKQAQIFTNHVAGAIHRVSSAVKVTVGSWSYKASSAAVGRFGNIWSDAALVAAGGMDNGVLDYYQIHYYNKMYPSFSPFVHPVDYWEAPEKPHVIGEFPNDPWGASSPYFYETLYFGGYAGAWGWAYNENNPEFDEGPYLENCKYMEDTYGAMGWPVVADTCTDEYPYDDGYTCAQQAAWGKCSEEFMASPVCDKSCGRCSTISV